MSRGALAVLAVAVLAACDPVHQDAVDALGGEAPGVRQGPLHRPGQPCLLCHDGAFGSPSAFSVAGTVFERPVDRAPAEGVKVHLTGADGVSFDATTNEAGNFYVSPDMYTPRYPLKVAITAPSAVSMNTLVETDGACGGCHVDPAGPNSPGHVYLATDDGGPPP